MDYRTMEEVIRLPYCRMSCLLTSTCQDCPAFLYLVNEQLPLELENAQNSRHRKAGHYRGCGYRSADRT